MTKLLIYMHIKKIYNGLTGGIPDKVKRKGRLLHTHTGKRVSQRSFHITLKNSKNQTKQ